ncbi:hypothetical protein MCOR27_011183 [Pyricularia oryzae]|uniref:Uncharacterized protein n=2 Tax=Pyricularia TaxID=48558 RepID=A0ABQ8NCU2_PYRGI|nr:hypothetical protein MCOR02_010101 [Pyricularia oryzae]KAI6295015.1 hypothetical protein MCOR33_008017 [Pyricularia grisea]KAI6252400.1 hypothetical protein MCOR19_010988 [Pyricularia oryzae]KAI6264467.1 hypothetical protein MCOR26_011331 [Pyricularia oryzae]KAI6266001.1 hypothetical protein MCOR27_011183 [Pyricularia oryzae]
MSSELCGRQRGTDQVSKYEVVGRHPCSKTKILCALVTWSRLFGGDADPGRHEAAQLFVVPLRKIQWGQRGPKCVVNSATAEALLPASGMKDLALTTHRSLFIQAGKIATVSTLKVSSAAKLRTLHIALHRACSYSASTTDGENHLIAEYCRVPETLATLLAFKREATSATKSYTCPHDILSPCVSS